MPDDDALLGQNEVDVRNEARNQLNALPTLRAKVVSHEVDVDDDTIRELWHTINHLRRLQETEAVSPAAELRRQESITRTRQEIARLMRS